jgi:hypothetical protein
MDDAIIVATAMQRGDDARRIFDIVDLLESQDRSAEDRAAILIIYAEALIRGSERTPRPANNNRQPSSPKERWGYDGPVTPRLPERDWWPLRQRIFERDDFTCQYCGEAAGCADHVVPLSRGGTNEEDNLVACCLPCNSSKCDRLVGEWEGRRTA